MPHRLSATVRFVTVLALASAVLACGGSAKKSADLLYDVRAFNEGLRWQKLPQSAVRIHPSEREAFLDEREQLLEELRIDDFEITRLKMIGKRQDTAKVQIKWTWHMDSIGLVHTTTSRQEWRRFGERWIMLGEAHAWGDVMPGVPEEIEDEEEVKDSEGKKDPAAPSSEDMTPAEEDQKSRAHRRVEAALRAGKKPSKIAE
jgi:hypothetical protein